MMKKEKESRCAAADQHVDRISDLPEEIIHGILYRMDSPSEAARTSILSRRFLHLWRSYPVLEFRDPPIRRYWSEHEQKFRSFSAASSRRLHNSSGSNNSVAPMALLAVRLSLPFFPNGCAEIKLPEGCDYLAQSNIPAMCWNFSRTKVLKLVNFHSQAPGIDLAAVTMESLEVLHLDSVSIGDETLCNFLSNSPNLRELSLIGVYDEVNLKSPLLQLEILHLHRVWKITQQALCILLCHSPVLATLILLMEESYGYCSKQEERLAIDLPNLKSLRIAGSPRSIHITSAPLLHTLELLQPYFLPELTVESPSSSARNLRAIVINNFSYRYIQLVNVNLLSLYFPSLHSLSFNHAYGHFYSGVLQISSSKLRHLSFSRWPHWLPLHIDAPNCLTLHYSMQDCTRLPEKIHIVLVDLAPSCRFVFDLSSHFFAIPHSWFRKFRKLLAMLAQSNPHLDVVLKVASLESLDQVESFDFNRPELVVQHLELATNVPKRFDVSTTGEALLNGFFRICHPKFLSLTRCNHDKPFFSKYIYQQLLKRDNVDSCSYCYDVKCWRHQLKDVKLKSDIDEPTIEISKDGDDELISSILKRGKIIFELTWH